MKTNPSIAPESLSEIINLDDDTLDFNIFWKIDNYHDQKPQSEEINAFAKKQIETQSEHIYDLPIFDISIPFIFLTEKEKETGKNVSEATIAKYIANLPPRDTVSIEHQKAQDGILEYCTAAIVLGCWNAKEKNQNIENFEQLINNANNANIQKIISVIKILQSNPTPVPQSIGQKLGDKEAIDALIASANQIYDTITEEEKIKKEGQKTLNTYQSSGILSSIEHSKQAANIAAGVAGGIAGSALAYGAGRGILPQISLGLIGSIAAKSGMNAYNENTSFWTAVGENMKALQKTAASVANAGKNGIKATIEYVHQGPEQERLQRTALVAAGGTAAVAGVWGLWKLLKKLSTNKEEKNESISAKAENDKNWSTLAKWGVGIGGVALGSAALATYFKNIIPNLPLELLKKEMEEIKKAKEEIKKAKEEIKQTIEELQKVLQNLQNKVEFLQGNITNATGETKRMLYEELQNTKQEILQVQEKLGNTKKEQKIIHEAESALVIQAAQEQKNNEEKEKEKTNEEEEKEIPPEMQIYWKEIIKILQKNGILTADEAKNIQNESEFKDYITQEFSNKEIQKIVKDVLGNPKQEILLGTTAILIILSFFMKGKLKNIFQVGSFISIFSIVTNNTQDSLTTTDQYIKTIQDIKNLLSSELKKNGYDDGKTYEILSTFIPMDILMLVQSSYEIPERLQTENHTAFEMLKDKLSIISSKEEKLYAQEMITKINLFQLFAKPKSTILLQDFQDLFLPFQWISLSPPPVVHKTENLGYNITITIGGKEITLKGFPINPLPNIVPEEEKQKVYEEKSKEALAHLENQISRFVNVYLKKQENTYLLTDAQKKDPNISDTIKNTLNIIKNIQSGEHCPSVSDIKQLVPILQNLTVIEGVQVQEVRGTIILDLPDLQGIFVGFTNEEIKKQNNPHEIRLIPEQETFRLATKRLQKLGGNAEKDIHKNFKDIYMRLPEGNAIKEHLSIYLSSNSNFFSADFFTDSLWWGRFFYLIAKDPNQNIIAKVEMGVLSISAPWGEFALMSLVDPIAGILDGCIGNFENGEELFWRSFIGTGVALSIAGSAHGFIQGKGILGKIGGFATGSAKGLWTGVRWNPLMIATWDLMKYQSKRTIINSINSNNKGELWKITKNRLQNYHFLPNSLQTIRNIGGGDPYKYLVEKYANLVREQTLYANQNNQVTWRGSHFSKEVDTKITNIRRTFLSIYKNDAEWRIFEDIGKEMAANNTKFANAIQNIHPEKYFTDASKEIIKNSSLTDIESKFSGLHSDIDDRIRTFSRTESLTPDQRNLLTQLEKVKLQIYADEMIANIKHWHNTNPNEIKTYLNRIKTKISSISGLEENEKKLQQSIVRELEKAIEQINKGRKPSIFFAKLNPFSVGWNTWIKNTRILPSVGETISGATKVGGIIIKGAGIIGGAIDAGGNAIEAGDSLYHALRAEEKRTSTYYTESGINASIAGAKTYLTYAGVSGMATIPSLIAYAALSATETVVLGAVEAQHQAEMTTPEFQTWGKEKLMHELTFMSEQNMNDYVKNLFHYTISKPEDIGNDKTKIQSIIWEALGQIEMIENNIPSRCNVLFLNAYTDAIQKLKTNFTYPKTVFETKNWHAQASEYALEIIKDTMQDLDTLTSHHITPPDTMFEYKENINKMNIILAKNTEQTLTGDASLEIQPTGNILEESMYEIATTLYGYNGPKNLEILKEKLFNQDKKNIHGIYWDKNKKAWKIHVFQSLIPDKTVEGSNDREVLKNIIITINTNRHSIFTSKDYSLIEQIIDRGKQEIDFIGNTTQSYDLEDNKNISAINKSSDTLSKKIIQSIFYNTPEKEKIQENENIFEQGIMLFAIIDGYTQELNIKNIQEYYNFYMWKNAKIKSINNAGSQITGNNVLYWDGSKKEWYLRGAINKKIISSPEDVKNIDRRLLSETQPSGRLITLQQCMEVVSEYQNKK